MSKRETIEQVIECEAKKALEEMRAMRAVLTDLQFTYWHLGKQTAIMAMMCDLDAPQLILDIQEKRVQTLAQEAVKEMRESIVANKEEGQ